MKKFLVPASIFLAMSTSNVMADIVHADDVIITGSVCVGYDCVNGESFGFDTIRLKENNVRIHFDDTSNSASFPNNDWRIVANDTSNGGANYLGIEDATAGRIPFRVEAGAPANALYVEADGDVGIKTANPVVDLHIVEGNTPTLRLEQDGSDGFTPQTWDIAGNETNFFLRDVTNGSKLSFRVFPNAPQDSLTIEGSTGDIGIGTNAPSAPLHVRRTGTAGTDLLYVTNGGPTRIALDNTASTNGVWRLNHASDGVFRIADDDGVLTEFALDPNGNLQIGGTITTTGTTCGGGCDFVFDSRYKLDSIEEHASKMWRDKHLPAVGPTKEGEPFNISEKTGGILNELETAHIYISQLNSKIEDRDELIAELHDRIVALEKNQTNK